MLRIPILPQDPNAIPVHQNCGRCAALCCHYVSTEIDVPVTKKDFDIIRWYLMHPGVRVYCEDWSGSWFVQYESRCRFLRDDNLCGIYDTRPQICRDLDPMACEFALGADDRFLFTRLEDFERWYLERDRRKKSRRQAKPAVGTKRRKRKTQALPSR